MVPVHNAPELVRRCIDSVLAHVGEQLGEIVVVDDASGAETVAMLGSLRHPKLRVVRTDENLGYGGSVNLGIASCRAPLVLQLNSDIEARSDFLAPLVAALAADPKLAALNPAGNTYRRYDLARYAKRAACVVTSHLSGYAFLIRRSVFDAAGGFDPAFGLGYFEDTDLSRRILRTGCWLGVHPDAVLHHESHGSFSLRPERRAVLEANRLRYHARWPAARRQVLLATGAARGSALPRPLVDEAWGVLDGGGGIWWVAPESPRELLALGMRGDRMGLLRGPRRMRRQRDDPFKRFTELWVCGDAPRLPASMLRAAARGAAIETRLWEPCRRRAPSDCCSPRSGSPS